MTHARRTTLEKQIQREIEAAIGAERDFLLLRNSIGAARYCTDDGKEFWVPYGLGEGSPDLVGILRVKVAKNSNVGIWLCLEVKAPEGAVEPEQEACHRVWRNFGALVYVVRSVADAKDALSRARRLES